MTLRCRPGDMAIVLAGDYSGHQVDVIQFLGTVDRISKYGEGRFNNCWETTAPRGAGRLRGSNGRWAFMDSELLPIRPGDLDEKEETERELAV